MKKLLIILFVSLLFTNQSIANDKVESMYNKCTSYIKIVNFGLENTSTEEKLNFIECKHSIFCFIYVTDIFFSFVVNSI